METDVKSQDGYYGDGGIVDDVIMSLSSDEIENRFCRLTVSFAAIKSVLCKIDGLSRRKGEEEGNCASG